jgi:hypothetical protein
MKGLKSCIALSIATTLFSATAAWADYDATPPRSSFTTMDPTVLGGPLGDAIEGVSTDDASGIYTVDVEFCSLLDGECYYSTDWASDCSYGCPTEYAWSVTLPEELPAGVYTATVSAEDDEFNTEEDGPSMTVIVVR